MPSNKAAYLPAPGSALEVKPAPYTSPREDEVVIKNKAIALNPADSIVQAIGDTVMPWNTYPAILGFDVAGEIAEVGSGVTRFRKGDRVLGVAVGLSPEQDYSKSAFQNYTVVPAHIASVIPDSLSFESAAVIPVCIATAASALFQTDHLSLQHPSVPAQPSIGKTLVVWGGATSVGCNAIQLATAAGYEVITTSSPKNFTLVKSLGANYAFDYNSPTVVEDITATLQNKNIVGAFAITSGSDLPCFEIVLKSQGRKFVSSAMPFLDEGKIPEGVEAKFVFCTDVMGNEVGPMIFGKFLPEALKEGAYKAAPEPLVVGSGLESLEEGIQVLKKGVSARKIVVNL